MTAKVKNRLLESLLLPKEEPMTSEENYSEMQSKEKDYSSMRSEEPSAVQSLLNKKHLDKSEGSSQEDYSSMRSEEKMPIEKVLEGNGDDISGILQRMSEARQSSDPNLRVSTDPINVEGEIAPRPKAKTSKKEERAPAPKQEVETAPSSPSSIIDNLNLDFQNIAPVEEQEEQNIFAKGYEAVKGFTDEYPNFWIGAAPLLMGLAFGDMAEGAKWGGSALMQKYKDDMQDRRDWMKEQWKRKEGLDSKWQKMPYEENGQTYMGRIDVNTGEMRDRHGQVRYDLSVRPDFETRGQMRNQQKYNLWTKKGMQYGYKADPTTKLVYRIDRRTGDRIPVFDVGSLNPRQQEIAMQVTPKYNAKVDEAVEAFNLNKSSLAGLMDDSILGNRAGIMRFVKEIETRLSDLDRAYYTAEVSALNQKWVELKQQTSNKENPRLLREARVLAVRAMKKHKDHHDYLRKKYGSQLQAFDFKPEDTEKVLGSAAEMEQGVKVYHPAYKTPAGKFKSKTISIDELDQYLKNGFKIRGGV
jgi:hypothetical protein